MPSRSASGLGVDSVTNGASPWVAQMQTLDPTVIIDTSGVIRAVASFLLVILFGGVILYVYGGRIEGAVDASMDNPLISVVYGLMAYIAVSFLVVYAYSQLSRLGIGLSILTLLGACVLGMILLTLGGFGFVVVGAWFTDTVGIRDPWLGLVSVSGVSAVAWLLLPFGLGLLVWLSIAAIGIGGPTHRWVHVSTVNVKSRS